MGLMPPQVSAKRCFAYCGDGLCVCAASAESWAMQQPQAEPGVILAFVALNRLIDRTGCEYASEAAWRVAYDGPFDPEKMVEMGLIKKTSAVVMGSMDLPDAAVIYTPCAPE